MTQVFTHDTAIPMNNGLMAWAQHQGPAMWHEIAKGLDFATPLGTIDLLLAAQWITHQSECDRATALLLLARAAEAGFHKGLAPAAMYPEAAQAFSHSLARALTADQFPDAHFALTADEIALLEKHFGPTGAFPLGLDFQKSSGKAAHNPPFAFYLFRAYRNKKAHLRVA
jgi:hypothetical protein